MLTNNFNDKKDCNTISILLSKIDCRLVELGNNLYDNISYMLNKNIDTCVIAKLLMYKAILIKKNKNPDYLKNWCICDIADAVRTLAIGCVRKCFKPDCDAPNYTVRKKIFTKEFNKTFQ